MKKGKNTGERHNSFSRLLRTITALVLILAMTAPVLVVNAAKADLEIKTTYGLENTARMGSNIPFYVTVTNRGGDFNGYVQIITTDVDENIMYEKDLSIAGGATKTISLTVPIEIYMSVACVRITDQKGKVVYSNTITLKLERTLSTINIGVLSDDFSALSYTSGVELFKEAYNTNIKTRIFELNSENFPQNRADFDMLDFVLITNYSTDRLSDTQLNALNEWVEYGGRLIIGTGSTVSKTLSGLKGIPALSPFRSDSVRFKTYTTKYGLTKLADKYTLPSDFGKSSSYDYKSYLDDFEKGAYDRIKNGLAEAAGTYLKDKDESEASVKELMDLYFEADSDFLWRAFSDRDKSGYSYKYNYIYSYDAYYSEEDNTYRFKDQLYSHFLEEMAFDEINRYYVTANGDSSSFTFSSPITAEITLFSVTAADTMLYGDDPYDSYPLTKTYQFGGGAVTIAGVDFTQNPLASYEFNSSVFRMILKGTSYDYMTNKIDLYYNQAQNRYYENDYNTYASTFQALSAASAPPFLLYLIVLVAYLVAIFVSFAILKKRRKNVYFWVTEALLAIAFGFLIFLCSFTTRIRTPEFRVARLKELTGNGSKTTDIATYIMPSKKTYKFNVRNSRNLKAKTESSWWSRNTINRAVDSFYLGTNMHHEDTTVIINNGTTLKIQGFVGENRDYANTGCFSQNPGGTYTNNSGYNLESAFVLMNGMIYLVGDLQNGATVAITSTTPSLSIHSYYLYSKSDTNIYSYFKGESNFTTLDLLFGGNSTNYRRTMTRVALYNLLQESLYYNDQIVVAGFTNNDNERTLSEGEKLRETDYTTLVFQYIDK